jgi:hypothetical protein
VRSAALLLAVAGCLPVYEAGTLPVAARAIGCLDAGLVTTTRPEATGPVVVVYFGNRCDHRVEVDLSRLRVVASSVDGRTVALEVYDPDREIGPRRLDARGLGGEWLEFHGLPVDQIAWLDVEIGHIAPDPAPRPQWIRARVAP